jgi:isopenicillin-N N-acyltransferase like protein
MRRFCPLGAAVLSLAIVAGCARSKSIAPQQSASAPATEPLAAPAYRGPLIELAGPPEQIGRDHGRLLRSSIQLLHDRYLKVYLGDRAHRFLALGAARMFEPYLVPAHLEEIDSLAKATEMDEREAVLAQCFLDLSPMTACSTITLPASASPDHIGRFGRNLDFMSLNVADKYSTVFIYRPAGRYAFASIAWPGMVGVLSGMNEHGLALANMEVTRSPRLPVAMPYTLLYRTVLERCRTVEEAIEFLRRTSRQTANNLMLMDATGDRAVVEITPLAVTVRRALETQPLISTNHQRGTDCDTKGRCWRYDRLRLQGQRDFGHIGLKDVQTMLAGVQSQTQTLQSMVFEPANSVLYLSTGTRAASGTFYRLDLKPYFSH